MRCIPSTALVVAFALAAAAHGELAVTSNDNKAVLVSSNKPKDSPFYNDNGKLLLYRVSGTTLSKVAEAPIGHWSQGAAFSADGRTLLVGNMVEKDVRVFAWDGSTLRETARIKVNGGPAAIRTAEK
jgi:sugar lactone lactonase YvrE